MRVNRVAFGESFVAVALGDVGPQTGGPITISDIGAATAHSLGLGDPALLATYDGTPGGDTYTGTSDDDVINGQGGNDVLAGAGGADTIDGGDGNDTLVSYLPQAPGQVGLLGPRSLDIYADRDTLIGGAGDDMLIAGYGDNVDGGAGANSLFLNLRGATSGVTADFRNLTTQTAPNFPQPMTVGGGTISHVSVVIIDGSDFADTLRGGDSSGSGQYSYGSIYGNGGDDRLTAGAYTELMDGGDGDDWIDGRTSNYISAIYGGEGNDIVYGSPNSSFSKAYGGNGNDTIYGIGEAYGEAGDDVIDNTSFRDPLGSKVSGGIGADTITGSDHDDNLSSGNAIFTVNGPPPDLSTLLPLDSGTEHDRVQGGGGNDVIAIGYGDDADGGTGSADALYLSLLSAPSGVTLDTTAIVGGASLAIGGGTIANFDLVRAIFGSSFADTFTLAAQSASFVVHGGDGDDTIRSLGGGGVLFGDAGNDTIIGSGFADTIYGGIGADTIQAGAGNDIVYLASATDLATGETIDGGAGTDTLSLPFAGTIDISGATTSIERIDRGGFTAGAPDVKLTTAQFAALNYLLVNSLTFTTGGSILFAGVTWADYGYTFTLSDAGNVFDLTGVTREGLHGVTVNGGSGDDTITMLPGSSSDTYYYSGKNDVIRAGGGNDTINAGGGSDMLYGGTGVDVFHGDDGDDVIDVSGSDFAVGEMYDGGAGYDTLRFASSSSIDMSMSTVTAIELLTFDASGGATLSLTGAQLLSFTTINGSNASFTLTTGGTIALAGVRVGGIFNLAPTDTVFDLTGILFSAGGLTVNGSIGNDTLIGSVANDILSGGDGNDRLDGRAGTDQMTGGLGDDTYILDNAGDRVFESAGGGNDTIESSVTVTSTNSANVETIRLTGTADINATGTAAVANILIGNSGNNTLDGGGGGDRMEGGAGDDIYYIRSAADVIVEGANGGNDTILVSIAAVAYTIAADVQVEKLATLTPTGTTAINLTGNAFSHDIQGNAGANILVGGTGNDAIQGFAGDDRLDGGAGADTLTGGLGDDVYVIDDAGDRAVENAGEGNDTIESSVTITGAVSANIETIRLTGTANIDATGTAAVANILIGNSGNNQLDGGSGVGVGGDRMEGGLGDDVYIIRSATDVIVEGANAGNDAAYVSVTAGAYTLGADVQVETLATLTPTGTTAINLTGNAFSHDIQGNAGANIIAGGTGNDIIEGFAGDDRLIGGGGADTLIGGAGDDVYVIDSADDVIVENVGEGNDTLKSIVNYVLAAGVSIENLRLTGSGNTTMTGNEQAQILVGNPGDNVLDGGGGGDRLKGGYGNDTYIIRDTADVVVETSDSGTNDVVKAAVSYALGADAWVETLQTINAAATTALTLTSNDHTTSITGNAGANVLIGGAGAETLAGLGGDDTLIGGGGADVFVFASGTGHDTIGDFTHGSDVIDLSAVGFTSFAAVQAASHDDGSGSAVIDLGGGNSVTVTGVASAALQSSDFRLGSAGAAIGTAAVVALSSGDGGLTGDMVFDAIHGWHLGAEVGPVTPAVWEVL